MSEIDKIYEQAEETEIKYNFVMDKAIDINNLHTENQLHSELCFKYNARKNKLGLVVDKLEELKKQTRSKLIQDCVKNPELCDPASGKYTDKKAEAYYRRHKEYISVIDALLDAHYQYNSLSGQLRIMEERKWQLKDLTTLTLSQYFESKESQSTRAVYEPDDIMEMALGKVSEKKLDEVSKTESNDNEDKPLKTKRGRRRR